MRTLVRTQNRQPDHPEKKGSRWGAGLKVGKVNHDTLAGRWTWLEGGIIEAVGRTTHNASMEHTGKRLKILGELRESRGIFHDELERLGISPAALEFPPHHRQPGNPG